MASVDELDFLLGEALGNIMRACGQVTTLDLQKSGKHLSHMGKAIYELWEVREVLHSMRPDIEPAYIREMDSDPVRYEELKQLREKAGSAEENGEAGSAHVLYAELLSRSRQGWFRMLAEAGLYRTSAEGAAQEEARGAGRPAPQL